MHNVISAQEALLTAKEAKELATSINSETARVQLASINNIIRKAAKLGDTRAYYTSGRLLPSVNLYLQNLGYTVKFLQALDQRDSDSYTISW